MPHQPLLFRAFWSILALLLTLFITTSCSPTVENNYAALVAWLVKNGAYVHPSIRPKLVSHGGFQIRGIVTDIALEAGTTIFYIPEKLVPAVEHPKMKRPAVEFPVSSDCEKAETENLGLVMKLAHAIDQGSKHFFAPYLKMLPTLDDFRAYHPFMADSYVRASFGALPILHLLMNEYHEATERQFKTCITAAGKMSQNAFLHSITSDVLWRSRLLVWTRAIAGPLDTADQLVPLHDLFNTGAEDEVNAIHAAKSKDILMKLTKNVSAGTEIVHAYCPGCDNELYLANWGMYMESGSEPVNNLGTVNCSAVNQGVNVSSPIAATLREAVLAELDLGSLAAKPTKQAARRSASASPRCHQGSQPLRCSLARLAWDTCAEVWGMGKSFVHDPGEGGASARNAHTWAQNNMGHILAKQGDLKGAVAAQKAALRANNKNPERVDQLSADYKDAARKLKRMQW